MRTICSTAAMFAICWGFLAAPLAAPLSAQPRPGDRLIAHGSRGTGFQAAIGVFMRGSGTFRSALILANIQRNVTDVMMDADNRHVIARFSQRATPQDSIVRISPLGIITTLATVPMGTDGALALDEDGGYLVAGGGNTLLKLSGSGMTSFALPFPPAHVAIDPLNGDYLVASFGGQLSVIDRRTLVVTTFSTGRFSSFFGADFDTRSDAMILASQIRPGLQVIDRQRRLISTLNFPGTTFGLSIDPGDGHLHIIQNFDLVELSSNGTPIRTSPLTGVPNPSAIEVYGSRPVSGSGVARPGATYTLRFGFPGGAGKNYAGLLSLGGLRPGTRFPGGGFIALAPDALFLHTATVGDLPGITQGLRGTLDALDGATATIRIPSAVPPGVRIYASVVLIDPTTVAGVRTANTWSFAVQP